MSFKPANCDNSSASQVVCALYEAINRRDVEAAIALIDEQCLYQDLNFPKPHQGKAAVRELFEASCKSVPADFQFVIDQVAGEGLSAGMLWHVQIDGIPFPNGRGSSFYRLSPETGLIIFARDVVEPPLKPGKAAFVLIRAVSPLVRRFLASSDDSDPRPEQERSESRSWLSISFWLLTAIYVYVLLLSPPGQLLPGAPIWAIRPETLREILNESLNFFFVLPILDWLGLASAPEVHPTSQAFFNFAEAWIFMFLPLLLCDRRGRRLPKVAIWGAAMFLTNVFLMPYMALRQNAPTPLPEPPQKGPLARTFGWTGIAVGAIAILWFLTAQPEAGELSQRLQYFIEQVQTDRVTIAFCVDLVLFGLFQAVLMGAVIPSGRQLRGLRLIPFWGLAIWLIL
ncbi:nuclear transport factor 2 family protein [Romeria aff. gracilis LEGE 07310]|uniref:Nuclear transport factor 2 family protein n=1 Tax=Vasconcelosia minhoensis LEGE 07310 TaxID=915328 RepID=A0A8J7ABZ8_9CYAN|nr:nuclear transport factor 2 family protein [Romeria gracilis]MBE9080260.1 nuclear transport factor 2 family protein [Romeria aff. gracilis LEGE 07310]